MWVIEVAFKICFFQRVWGMFNFILFFCTIICCSIYKFLKKKRLSIFAEMWYLSTNFMQCASDKNIYYFVFLLNFYWIFICSLTLLFLYEKGLKSQLPLIYYIFLPIQGCKRFQQVDSIKRSKMTKAKLF